MLPLVHILGPFSSRHRIPLRTWFLDPIRCAAWVCRLGDESRLAINVLDAGVLAHRCLVPNRPADALLAYLIPRLPTFVKCCILAIRKARDHDEEMRSLQDR